MSDLIDRQAAIDAAHRAIFGFFNICDDDHESPMTYSELKLLELNKAITTRIRALPSAQPEIIRCKDCQYWTRTVGDDQWSLGDCNLFDKHLVMCNGFCSWAERKDDGTD